MMTHRYKVVQVQAIDTRTLDTGNTIAIPSWLIQAAANGLLSNERKPWIVQKPDGSLGMYSDEDFEKEFEALV